MKKILIFGTGSACRDVLSLLPATVRIVALIDNDKKKQGRVLAGHPVIAPDAIREGDVDAILIAARAVDAIRDQLLQLGVPASKVCAFYPSYSAKWVAEANADITKVNALGFDLTRLGLSTTYLWPQSKAPFPLDYADTVRLGALRLVWEEITAAGLPGCVAELGVYRGEFSAILNRAFADRPLHLFDTFEGFSELDLPAEAGSGFSQSSAGEFQDTSIEVVMARLPFPERVSVFKGWFPDSAAAVDASYALVSLDVDLYQPTLAGLEYFYPRLVRGGFIFVHDYNNKRYQGVKQAAREFIAKHQVAAFPLPDFCGSLIITKSA